MGGIYRYDQRMRLGWKVFLPLSLVLVVVVAGWMQFGLKGWVSEIIGAAIEAVYSTFILLGIPAGFVVGLCLARG